MPSKIALVLKRPFPNLILFQFLLSGLYLRFVNNLVLYQNKENLKNYKAIFPVILLSFDLYCHGQICSKTCSCHVWPRFRETVYIWRSQLRKQKTKSP